MSESKLKPQGDRIVVKQDAAKDKSLGGVIIPETGKDRAPEGVVLAVGPGRRLDDGNIIPVSVRPGDRVIFSKYTGSDIKIDGEEMMIVSERDILAVITDAPVNA